MEIVGAKLLLLVALGPVAALYDLATNPSAPPQIFAAQFEQAFGHPPGTNLPRPKHVYVKRG